MDEVWIVFRKKEDLMTNQGANQRIRRGPLVTVLLSAAFISILNQTLLGTAIPPIMKDLSLTENTVQWLQSIFFSCEWYNDSNYGIFNRSFYNETIISFSDGAFYVWNIFMCHCSNV